MLGSGIILTGGASQLEGLGEMGEFIFDVPVRRGHPGKVGGLTDVIKASEYATCVGLLLYGLEHSPKMSAVELHLGESLDGITKKVKEFFTDLF